MKSPASQSCFRARRSLHSSPAALTPALNEDPMPTRIIRIDRDGHVVNQDYRVGLSKSGANGKPQEVLWIDTQNGGPWTITFDKTSTAPSTYPLQNGSP